MVKYFERFRIKYGMIQDTNSHPNILSTERGNRANPPRMRGKTAKAVRGSYAFTLVELIVVIVILAILGTISFISLQNYSSFARDTKRVNDVKSLISKIIIENTKGVDLSQLISSGSSHTGNIYGVDDNIIVGTIKFENLNENSGSFVDPTTKSGYLMAYSVNTKRVAGMYKSETTGKNVCIGEIQLFDKYVEKCDGSGGSETPIYSWLQTENWSACSAECGGGIQTKIIICKNDLNGQQVNDNNCDIGNKPSPLTQSCNIQVCPIQGPPTTNNPSGDVVLCTNTNEYWAKPLLAHLSYCSSGGGDGLLCEWSVSRITECSSTGTLGTFGSNSKSVSGCNVSKSGDNYPAFKACLNLGTGWRLPTIAELRDLYNCNEKSELSLLSEAYWSSSEYNVGNARYVYMSDGNVGNNYSKDDYNGYVVCIYDLEYGF